MADKNAATFILELKDKSEYVFYIPPDTLEYTSPTRMTAYQTISGNSHVDHLGEGIAQIKISGTTGWRMGGLFEGLFAYHSYQLLRKIVDDYWALCKSGGATNDTLSLSIDMPDAPNFGKWYVSVDGMALKRAASAPLLFQYAISFICLSSNLVKLELEDQQSTLAGLRTPEKPKPETNSGNSQFKQLEAISVIPWNPPSLVSVYAGSIDWVAQQKLDTHLKPAIVSPSTGQTITYTTRESTANPTKSSITIDTLSQKSIDTIYNSMEDRLQQEAFAKQIELYQQAFVYTSWNMTFLEIVSAWSGRKVSPDEDVYQDLLWYNDIKKITQRDMEIKSARDKKEPLKNIPSIDILIPAYWFKNAPLAIGGKLMTGGSDKIKVGNNSLGSFVFTGKTQKVNKMPW